MDLVVQGRNAGLFRAQVGDGTHIAVRQTVLGAGFLREGVDFSDAVGYLEIEQVGGPLQALGMLRQLEDFAAVHTLTLKDRRAIVKGMGQNVRFRFPPGD